jgi:hypothetical protein
MSRWSPSYRLQPHPDDFATALEQIGNSALLVGEAAFDRRRQRIAEDEITSRDKWRQADADRANAEAEERRKAREAQARQQQIQNAGQGIFDASDPGLFTNREEWARVPDLMTGQQDGFLVKGRARREDVTGLGGGAFYDPTRDRARVQEQSLYERRRAAALEDDARNQQQQIELERLRQQGYDRRSRVLNPAPASLPNVPRGRTGSGSKPPIPRDAEGRPDQKMWIEEHLQQYNKAADGMYPAPEELTNRVRTGYESIYGQIPDSTKLMRPQDRTPTGGFPRAVAESARAHPQLTEQMRARAARDPMYAEFLREKGLLP